MTFLAFGNHTVRNLLRSSYFTFKKVLMREEHKNDKELLKLLEEKQIPYQLLDKVQFSRYNFDKKNQGLVAFIRNYNYISLITLLKSRPRHKFPLIIMLDSIEDPHNFGSILRTSAGLAVDGIIISNKNQVSVNNTVIKVSAGGAAHVPVCQVPSLVYALQELKKYDYQIIATVCQPQAYPYHQFNWSSPTCLILGNEHHGIRPKLIKKSDHALYIPVSNNMDSFNVAVSCGIICAHIIHQEG